MEQLSRQKTRTRKQETSNYIKHDPKMTSNDLKTTSKDKNVNAVSKI